MLIGITGGIGSGKSTICHELIRRGYPVYDCDSRAKALIKSDPSLRAQIVALLGEEAYDGEQYNTRYVSSRVFGEPSLLLRLNAIVHPAVRRDIVAWAAEHTVCYVESAILYESGIDTLCQQVVYVDAPLEVRIRRTVLRDGADTEAVRRRIVNQNTDDAEHRSDIVLVNDGLTEVGLLVDRLERHVEALHAMG